MAANTFKIPLFKVFMSKDVLEPLNNVLMSGYITQGSKVDEFESKLRTYFNNEYVLTVNSATSGLTLALRLLDLDRGDEILTPSLTCTATNWPILNHGLKIKWVDVDPETANVNLDDLKSKLSPTTKAIQVVHWAGYPVDLDALVVIQDYCKETYGFRPMIIEDCAHAFGAEYKGAKLGNHGNICVFSLQAIKHLTTGDGGLIILPNEEMYNRAKLLRWYGIDRSKRSQGKDFRMENDIVEWGYKFHMNDINATIGLYNLPHIDGLLKKNRANADYLYSRLRDVPGITLLENRDDRKSSWWLFTIRVDRKDEFIQQMSSKSIMVSQVHKRNDGHTCVSDFKTSLPLLDEFEKEIVCLPVGWWLEETDLEYMVNEIKNFISNV